MPVGGARTCRIFFVPFVLATASGLVQNCCFVGRDNCGRAIGILRETNGHRVEFEEYHSPQHSLQGRGQEAVASHVFWGKTERYTSRPPRLPLPACTDYGVIRARLLEMT